MPRDLLPNQRRIKEIRTHLGLTVSDFAIRLKLKPGTIYAYEEGFRNPTAQTMMLAELMLNGA